MGFEAQQGVVAVHAATVIRHLDQALATEAGLHPDAPGTCVQRILHQFFDHGGRALDHLAGGDAIGNFG